MDKRITYKISPEQLNDFTQYFRNLIYPIQETHGAKLIGRWVNESQTEVLVIWQYKSQEQYESIEKELKNMEDEEERLPYIEIQEEALTSATYFPPKHLLAVSGYITNEEGEVLLVRNYHRSDTMEMPGGQVEEGETLEEAVHREVYEETGIQIQLHGITGIYQNRTGGVTSVVFRGEYVAGQPTTAENETMEVFFTKLTKENIDQYITREQFRSRTLDAMDANYLPYETFKVRPYELLSRFEAKKK